MSAPSIDAKLGKPTQEQCYAGPANTQATQHACPADA